MYSSVCLFLFLHFCELNVFNTHSRKLSSNIITHTKKTIQSIKTSVRSVASQTGARPSTPHAVVDRLRLVDDMLLQTGRAMQQSGAGSDPQR